MIAENVQNIEEILKKTCLQHGRARSEITLIAVSKTFGADAVAEAHSAGIVDFGENYVQEVTGKRLELLNRDLRWHFIGHLQTNKVKYIAEWVHMVHSVDSHSLAAELDKRCGKAGRVLDVLIEVNTSEEATKFGVRPAEALSLIASAAQLPHLRVKGLMTIGPFTDDKSATRASFRTLREIFAEANRTNITPQPMTELSMGMSHDFPEAIAEGSTMVRIGTAIFGSRTYPTP